MTARHPRLARVNPDALRLFDETTLAVFEAAPTMSAPTASPTAAPNVAPNVAPSRSPIPSGDDALFTVQVERSAKRKRTVGAQLGGDVLKIVVPSWMSLAEQDHWVDVMSARFRRKLSTDRIDLAKRSTSLARCHDLPRPREIKWSNDMASRWGSCTPSTGMIRISSRIAKFPDWVIDYVIVHELAHLEVGDHSESFWRLVHRYPKAERAIGYLIAKSGDADQLD